MKARSKWLFWAAPVVATVVLASPALAEDRMERELALEPGGQLVLGADGAAVSVTGTSRSGVKVVVTARRDADLDDYDFRFDERPGEVEIVAKKKGSGFLGRLFSSSSHRGLNFDIEVPHETELDIATSGGSLAAIAIRGNVVLDTAGGSIDVEEVEGTVRIDTSGGAIRVTNVEGDVDADTSGGSVNIEEVTGDVQAETSGGPIRVLQVRGRVVADTSGGSVEAEFTPGTFAGGYLSTSGGGVRVRLDPAIGLEIDAQSSGGSVSCDLPLTIRGKISRTSVKGTVGAGGELLKVRTSGGSIRIEEL
jgi:DUF4097 and DUF4098 domain-containing protein YvlB